MYTVSLVLNDYQQAQVDAVQPGAIDGVRGGVHAEYDLHQRHPLAPGANVGWEVFAHCAQPTSAGVLVAMRIVVSDEQGPGSSTTGRRCSSAATSPSRSARRSSTTRSRGREHPVGTETFPVTRDQTFRYAGACPPTTR